MVLRLVKLALALALALALVLVLVTAGISRSVDPFNGRVTGLDVATRQKVATSTARGQRSAGTVASQLDVASPTATIASWNVSPGHNAKLQAPKHKRSANRHRKLRLLVIRTNRCASTAFGGWILRAVYASRGRLEAYRADDGEVALTGVRAWAAHVNAALDHRTIKRAPHHYVPFPPMIRGQRHTDAKDTSGAEHGDITAESRAVTDATTAAISNNSRSTLIVAFIRSPPSQFPSAYGSFKSSGMGYYGESLSDTLRRPPRPEHWRLDNMNARSLGWGPLVSGAWDKRLSPAQERRGAGLAPAQFVAQVEREVDLVLVVDHMVESMVLLRRALGLDAHDLHENLAMLIGINGHLSKSPMSPENMKRVCSDTWSSVDCALFDHFNASLWAQVKAGGEAFASEVREVRHRWSTLDKCCADNSCALAKQIHACDRIHDSVNVARHVPTIVQF